MIDQVASGREAPPRRWPGRIAVAVLLLAVLAVGADRWQSRREVTALLSRAASAQATAEYADRRIAAVVVYTAPQLNSASAPARVQNSLRQLVQDTARGQLRDVRAARAQAAAVTVLPWHDANQAARRAYLSYLDARIGVLVAVAGDLDVLSQPQPRVTALLGEAGAALVRAAGTGSEQRIATTLR